MFHIKLTHGEETQYSIYTMNGVEIQKGKFISEKHIRFATEQTGIYILQLITNQSISIHKISVE